jgi:hypothetical protein
MDCSQRGSTGQRGNVVGTLDIQEANILCTSLRGSIAMVLDQQGFTGFSYPRTLVTAGMDCSQRGSTGYHRRNLINRGSGT